MTKRFFRIETGGERKAESQDQPPAATSTILAGADTSEARLALLIGNARYDGAPLRNPVRDVRRLAYILEQLGFVVTLVENGDKPSIERALSEFVASLRHCGQSAVAFVHFAGHGLQHGPSLYLIPAGAGPTSIAALPVAATSLETVLASVGEAPLKALVVVADVCRILASERESAGGSDDVFTALSNLAVPTSGALVVYSTALGSAADDGDGESSPYATALAERLPALIEPGRRIHEVFVEAADAVRSRTDGAQSPALFLQGSLPPLTLGAEDERRRERGIRILPPKVPWLRLGLFASAALLVVAVGIGAWLWQTTYPEKRTVFLARIGLAVPEVVDTACTPPWNQSDLFGLTRADWCNLLPAQIAAKPSVLRLWTSTVAPAIGRGNPKALMLYAARRMAEEGVNPSSDDGIALDLVRRAAAQGLPMAEAALRNFDPKAGISSDEAEAGFRASARAFYLPSLIEMAKVLLESGKGGPAFDILRAAEERDASGTADLLMADAYGGVWHLDGPAPDPGKAVRHLERATAKGNVEAMRRLLRLDRDGQTRLSAAEATGLAKRIAAADQVDGLYWRGLEQLRRGPSEGIGAAIDLLKAAADQGHVEAMLALADAYARGVPDITGKPSVAIDPRKALHFYDEAAAHGSDWARFETARLHEQGDLGAPDRSHAISILSDLADDSRDPQLKAVAARQLGLARRAAALEADRTPWDVDIGAADAPVSVVAYFPVGASIASAFYRDTMRPLIRQFAQKGLIRLTMRLAWGWQEFAGPSRRVEQQPPEAIEAAGMLSCAEPAARPALLDRLADDPSGWTGKDTTDRADFMFASTANNDASALAACLADTASIDGDWRKHVHRNGVTRLPFIAVNGGIVTSAGYTDIVEAIIAAVPPRLWPGVPPMPNLPFLQGPAERIGDDGRSIDRTAADGAQYPSTGRNSGEGATK